MSRHFNVYLKSLPINHCVAFLIWLWFDLLHLCVSWVDVSIGVMMPDKNHNINNCSRQSPLYIFINKNTDKNRQVWQSSFWILIISSFYDFTFTKFISAPYISVTWYFPSRRDLGQWCDHRYCLLWVCLQTCSTECPKMKELNLTADRFRIGPSHKSHNALDKYPTMHCAIL